MLAKPERCGDRLSSLTVSLFQARRRIARRRHRIKHLRDKMLGR
ncbi:MAG: hypothetical protein V7L05_22990 [Nostoc sp.]